MRKLVHATMAALAAAAAGCSGTPGGVVPPESMARLMADMRVAGAVVSVNSGQYRSDSAKQVLRRAVLMRHDVSEADFDSSLVWYGHNIGKYQEVTQRSIELLEERLAAVGSVAGGVMSVSGDSVDVWSSAQAYVIDRRSPSQYITFAIDADRNMEAGDVYTWRLKLVTAPQSAAWAVSAEYADGAVEVQNMSIPSTNTRPELIFHTDSTRELRSIRGWLRVDRDAHRPVYIDSVSLVRRRADGPAPRNYRQFIYNAPDPAPSPEPADTTAAAG